MKFKKPKNGQFYTYCCFCKHYIFREQIGCACLGTCVAIPDEPRERDAYDPPCGLYTAK